MSWSIIYYLIYLFIYLDLNNFSCLEYISHIYLKVLKNKLSI